MKVGDYVRTLEYIRKIRKIKNNYVYCDIGVFCFNEIIKSSPNIIDLIEVGDYVNGCYVDEILSGNECYDDKPHFHLLKFNSFFKNKDIKSIVTKEQFERMEYKIESEE